MSLTCSESVFQAEKNAYKHHYHIQGVCNNCGSDYIQWCDPTPDTEGYYECGDCESTNITIE